MARQLRSSCFHCLALATFLMVLSCQLASALPAQVLLLRHAEKNETRGDYNLDQQGLQRAMQLAAMIPRCFFDPTQIHTFEIDFTTSENARSYQTAVPLGVYAGINVYQVTNSTLGSRRFGEQVLEQPQYDGSSCVFVWEHRSLPELAEGLGWPDMPPIQYENYDELYLMTYSAAGGTKPVVLRFNQTELFDSSCGWKSGI